MNCKGDEDVDAKRSRPSIGKPEMCHASKERVVLFGTDQRITSGPAARTAAFRGRIHGCTRTIRKKVRVFSCAAGAVHTWHDDDEFLAAIAAGEVNAANRLADAQRELAQHLVIMS